MSKSCHELEGKLLESCQRQMARNLKKRYGEMSERGPAFMWGRSEIKTSVGTMVPIPPQLTTFINFRKKDAQKLKTELNKLKDEPVILTGGGGYGYHFCFLDDVSIKCNYQALRDSYGNIIRDAKGEWVPDKKKQKECSIRVHLRAFPGEDFEHYGDDKKRWDPFIGSYRITALHGFGAERLMKKVPGNWERN